MACLESLDLSDNLLEDADALGSLERLAELDLSGNDIDDFAFLERMPALRYVNATGNPRMGAALRSSLGERGVIVID
jgi:Leucine-rich repeat (LRR) protein